ECACQGAGGELKFYRQPASVIPHRHPLQFRGRSFLPRIQRNATMRCTFFTISILFLTAVFAPAQDSKADKPPFLPLWPDGAPGALGKEPADIPAVMAFLPAKDKANGAAVVVFPGGGYGNLAMDHEGQQIGRWLNSHGIAGIV